MHSLARALLLGFLGGTLGVSLIVACAGNENDRHIDDLKKRLETPSDTDVFVVAHRTCWQETAENSIAGIERCVEIGVEMIEIDIRETADGNLVLLHDETMDRTTNATGRLIDLSLAEVKEFRLKAGAGGDEAPVTNETVPTLEEALRAAEDRLLVNLDIKEDLYQQALEIARDVGAEDQILIKLRAAPDDPLTRQAAALGETYFMPIIRECNDDPLRDCMKSLSEAIPRYTKYDPIAVEVVNHTDAYLLDGIPVAKDLDLRIWVNTLGPRFAAGRSDDKSLIDPDRNWGFLIDNGVDIIQTDRPEELIAYLLQRNARPAAHSPSGSLRQNR